MNDRPLAHARRAARYADEALQQANDTKARVRRATSITGLRGYESGLRYGFGAKFGAGVRPTQGKVTLVSSDGVSFVVDFGVAHMFEVMRAMEVDDTELVPVPDVDGATLQKALEYCEAHAARAGRAGSAADSDTLLAWDDAYARSVGTAPFELVGLASQWGCEGLARVLAKNVLLVMMEEYASVGALMRAFDVDGEFTDEVRAEASALEPELAREMRRAAFHWHRHYFVHLQRLTFARSRRAQIVGATRENEREAQIAVARVAATDWFYTAFLARLRALRRSHGDARVANFTNFTSAARAANVAGVAAKLLFVRPSVWRMMFERLCAMRPDDLADAIPRQEPRRDARQDAHEMRRMGLCLCGVPIGPLLGATVAHGYYESVAHRRDLADMLLEAQYMAHGELAIRPHSGKGLLRFARAGYSADVCEHQGKPWTLGSW